MASYIMTACLVLVISVSASSCVSFPGKTSSQCTQSDPLQDAQLMDAVKQFQQKLGPPGCNPSKNRTCQEILNCFPSSSSDYYQIQLANGSSVQVYCDMEGTNCGGEVGWTRVAYVNMTESGATCPQGLAKSTFPLFTLCGRTITGCDGTVFSTQGLTYSHVCGRVTGYQFGGLEAFGPYIATNSLTINNAYVDGVSITYGNTPRQHIWTFANGDSPQLFDDKQCPCNSGSSASPPPYVGADYYCESGLAPNATGGAAIFHDEDPIWDGQQCDDHEMPCCTNPNLPWFIKDLPQSTTEDIEVRLCGSKSSASNGPLVELIELFIR